MKTSIEQVKEFHEVFGHPIAESPICLPLERALARVSYMDEELSLEYVEASRNNDLVECIDALIDLQYFLDGTLVEHGVAHLKDELFAEVHRSNMSKVCTTEQHAFDTIDSYTKQGTQTYHKKVGEYWVVYRVDNQKVAKALGWSEPDLKSIIYNEHR